MDETGRKITKIAREVGKFTFQNMRRKGVGAAEFDVIHLVRHNPGITQTQVVQALNMDKGAAAKRVASLENKGYLIRRPNPADGRSQLLYATEAADGLRNSTHRRGILHLAAGRPGPGGSRAVLRHPGQALPKEQSPAEGRLPGCGSAAGTGGRP